MKLTNHRATRPLPGVIATLVYLGLTVAVHAEEAPAYKLELKPADGLPNGKVATIQGTARPAGDKFFVESVGVLQPVVVSLVAQHKGDVIKVALGKQRWDESLRVAETGADGKAILKLRTQGELRLTVSASDEKPYWLVVWVGDEVKPDFTPAITSMKNHKGDVGGAAPSGTKGIVIAAVLGVLLLLGVVWLAKKQKQQTGGRS